VYASPGDVADLADTLQRLLDDPARRAALGPALRRRAARDFSWDAVGTRQAATYEHATAARTAHRRRAPVTTT
jgi:glycosyltransferase involved in cell wall biosynthesis